MTARVLGLLSALLLAAPGPAAAAPTFSVEVLAVPTAEIARVDGETGIRFRLVLVNRGEGPVELQAARAMGPEGDVVLELSGRALLDALGRETGPVRVLPGDQLGITVSARVSGTVPSRLDTALLLASPSGDGLSLSTWVQGPGLRIAPDL